MDYPWESLATGLQMFFKMDEKFDADKLFEEYKEADKRFKFHPLVVALSDTEFTHLSLKGAYGDPLSVSLPSLYGTKISEWTCVTNYTPYTKGCIASLGLKIIKAQYSKMAPNSELILHIDPMFLTRTCIRLHIPIITNPKSGQKICHEMSPTMNPGELWVGDYRFPHYGWNKGEIERVHIMIDCEILTESRYAPFNYLDQNEKRIESLNKILTSYLSNYTKISKRMRKKILKYLGDTTNDE